MKKVLYFFILLISIMLPSCSLLSSEDKEKAATRYRDDKAAREEWMKEFGVAFPDNLASKINITAIKNPYAGNMAVDAGNEAAVLEAYALTGENPNPDAKKIAGLRQKAKNNSSKYVRKYRDAKTQKKHKDIAKQYREDNADQFYLRPMTEGSKAEYHRRRQKMPDSATADDYLEELVIYFSPNKRNSKLSDTEMYKIAAIVGQFKSELETGKFVLNDKVKIKKALFTIRDRLPDDDYTGLGFIYALEKMLGRYGSNLNEIIYITLGLIPVCIFLMYGAYTDCLPEKEKVRDQKKKRKKMCWRMRISNKRMLYFDIGRSIINQNEAYKFVDTTKFINDRSIQVIRTKILSHIKSTGEIDPALLGELQVAYLKYIGTKDALRVYYNVGNQGLDFSTAGLAARLFRRNPDNDMAHVMWQSAFKKHTLSDSAALVKQTSPLVSDISDNQSPVKNSPVIDKEIVAKEHKEHPRTYDKDAIIAKSKKAGVFIICGVVLIGIIYLVYLFFVALFGDDAPVKFASTSIKSLFVIGLGAGWAFITSKMHKNQSNVNFQEIGNEILKRKGEKELLDFAESTGEEELLNLRAQYLQADNPSPAILGELQIAYFKSLKVDNAEAVYRTAGELGLSYEEITAIAKSFDSHIDDDAAHRIWEEAYSKRGEKTNN